MLVYFGETELSGDKLHARLGLLGEEGIWADVTPWRWRHRGVNTRAFVILSLTQKNKEWATNKVIDDSSGSAKVGIIAVLLLLDFDCWRRRREVSKMKMKLGTIRRC